MRILIAIIAAHSNERWERERKLWESYMIKQPNIRVVFLECKESFTLVYPCKESFVPGIYQKTLLCLSDFPNFDFYIRTNLSTFFIFSYLESFLEGFYHETDAFYTGHHQGVEHCEDWKNAGKLGGVQGLGIVMNKKARDILVQKGGKGTDAFWKHKSDDILICKILNENNVKKVRADRFVHQWDNSKSYESNTYDIDKFRIPAVRLKDCKDPDVYTRLVKDYYE